jgi:hypothetical protein
MGLTEQYWGRSFFAVVKVVGRARGLAEAGGLALAGLEFRRGQRLGCWGMYYMVKDLAASAGLENFYRQQGQHAFASHLIEDGMDAYLEM